MQREARPDVSIGIELAEQHAVAPLDPGRPGAAERRRDFQLDDAVHHRHVRHRDRSAGDERAVPHPAAVADGDGHRVPGEVGRDTASALPWRPTIRRAHLHHHVPDGAVGSQIELGVTPPHDGPAIHAVGDQPRGRARDLFDRDGVVAEGGDEAVALGGRGVAAGGAEGGSSVSSEAGWGVRAVRRGWRGVSARRGPPANRPGDPPGRCGTLWYGARANCARSPPRRGPTHPSGPRGRFAGFHRGILTVAGDGGVGG